ncbi:hypothetical protein WJX73_003909 [Symbiochloris irregularis]|uniref:Protein arginine methyltransferase NDUFAF7 n=1 Tax=Symbiochloris irregularis TaxID=706552 RepID=A0AAW1NSZ5_9CHLO
MGSLGVLPGARCYSSERIISIDRSGLIQPSDHLHDVSGRKTPGDAASELSDHLRALIRFRGGPITVAEYVSQALTHPQLGYYSVRDAFGQSGDFITSPDISQLFGEMLGVWCVLAWQQMGQPRAVRLAELGPGRGTLMADLLRSTAAFPAFASSLSVSLVEMSPKLREEQRVALGCPEAEPAQPQSAILQSTLHLESHAQTAASALSQRSSLGAEPQVSWHATLDEIPTDAPLLLLAHEVDFNALGQGVEESGAAASAWGPMHQGPFLQDLGIATRLEALISGAAADPEQQDVLYDGAMRLVSGAQPSSPDLTTPGAIESSGAGTLTLKPRKGASSEASAAEARRIQDDHMAVHEEMTRARADMSAESANTVADEAETEGMGYQYMAMAITPSSQGPPFPFAAASTAS